MALLLVEWVLVGRTQCAREMSEMYATRSDAQLLLPCVVLCEVYKKAAQY